MNKQEFQILNRKRDLYFRHEEQGTVNAICIPKDWADEIFDPENPNDVFGYAATRLVSNDKEVDTLWLPVKDLTEEITKEEAKKIHPNMFVRFEEINNE